MYVNNVLDNLIDIRRRTKRTCALEHSMLKIIVDNDVKSLDEAIRCIKVVESLEEVLTKEILKSKVKSEYKQASIIIVRDAIKAIHKRINDI